jgi:hypothetical protein
MDSYVKNSVAVAKIPSDVPCARVPLWYPRPEGVQRILDCQRESVHGIRPRVEHFQSEQGKLDCAGHLWACLS